MKYFLTLSISCLHILSSSSQSIKPNTQHQLDSIIQAAAKIYLQDSARVGLSIGITYNNNKRIYHFGEVAAGTGILPTDQTTYEIGSITKTFTGLMVAHAITEGKMDLNADIRKYLPGLFSNLQYPNGDPVKLGYVLGHTAQFPNSFSDAWDANRTTQQFLTELHAIKLDTLRPFKYGYSNAGYQLLGYMLEQLYGMSYEKLLQKTIAIPLNMRSTSTSLALTKRNLAKGYNASRQEMANQPDSFPAAGAIKSTIPDMLNYMQYQLAEKDAPVRLTHRILQGDIDNGAHGFQWSVGKTWGWEYYMYTDGGTKGYRTFCIMYPEYGLGVVLLTNETDAKAGAGCIRLLKRY